MTAGMSSNVLTVGHTGSNVTAVSGEVKGLSLTLSTAPVYLR